MFDSVITAIQQSVMEDIVRENDDFSFLPPRYVVVPDHVRASGRWPYGPVLLLIGAPDPQMDDCDCDDERGHVLYSAVRSDGQSTAPITSGTVFEQLIVPDEAQWDNALPVTPNMWPTPNVPDTIPGM